MLSHYTKTIIFGMILLSSAAFVVVRTQGPRARQVILERRQAGRNDGGDDNRMTRTSRDGARDEEGCYGVNVCVTSL